MHEAEDRLGRNRQHQIRAGRPVGTSGLLQGLRLSAEPGSSKKPQAWRLVPTFGDRAVLEAGRLPRRSVGLDQGHGRRGSLPERRGGANRDADVDARLRDLVGATVNLEGRQSDPGRLLVGQQRGHHYGQQRHVDDQRRPLRQRGHLSTKDDRRREAGSFHVLLLEQFRRAAGERLRGRSRAGERLLQGTVSRKGTFLWIKLFTVYS